jgi:molecular chaperone HtpG
MELAEIMNDATNKTENRAFEADVSRLLHMMVHSVYSDKDVFLRELISNAADACEKLRYEAIAEPALLGDDGKLRILVGIDAENRRLTIEDNGIGMSRADMVEALGTIARSGTRAFMERVEAAQAKEGAQLIGQFGVGFYSAFMVADRVEVYSRKAGEEQGWHWISEGKGSFTIGETEVEKRGTRVVLHLRKAEQEFLEPDRLRRIIKTYSDHIALPVVLAEGEKSETVNTASALWARP